jgi:hypothetical protein
MLLAIQTSPSWWKNYGQHLFVRFVCFLVKFFTYIQRHLVCFNKLVSNSLYQIPTTSSQGCQMVVGCGWYHIVGDSLSANSQDTILMLGTIGFFCQDYER